MSSNDKYGHYVNDEGVEFNINTDKNGVDHINIYDSCPAENENHGSIHINFDGDSGTGNIVDTTDGDKESTDVGCYLTTACMRHMASSFDDNCEELIILRWFRDKYVSGEDINHYYKTAPIIVSSINSEKDNNRIYNYVYNNVVKACVEAIKKGDYEFAYNRYKSSILTLEEEFARPKLTENLAKVLRKVKNVKNKQ